MQSDHANLSDPRREGITKIRHFNRFYTSMLGVLDRRFLQSTFSLSEGRILFEIYHDPGIHASAIKQALNIDEGYLSRIIKQFVKQKLVYKDRSQHDARSFGLRLTKKGEEEFRRLNDLTEEELGRVIKHLSDKQLTGMAESMMGIEADFSGHQHPENYPRPKIVIRTELRPGDLGYIGSLHGKLYSEEYGYGIGLEYYIIEGLLEFYNQYDPSKDGVWICEDFGRIVGSIFLKHRGTAAQLRYFWVDPAYRGFGLGKRLMEYYMNFLREHGYQSSYLWTLKELGAAHKLYKKHGFRPTEERPSAMLDKPAIELRYDLLLID